MNAPLLSAPLESTRANASFNARSLPSNRPVTARLVPGKLSGDRLTVPDQAPSRSVGELELLLGSLVEALPQGVIVVSRSLQPIYWNRKATELCKTRLKSQSLRAELPAIVSDTCQKLLRSDRPKEQSLVVEYQVTDAEAIRITVRWLAVNGSTASPIVMNQKHCEDDRPMVQETNQPAFIQVFLESCHEILQEELRIEQRKYDLTDREAEIWMLLRKEHTYQEIARRLQISLNTVKTHVKNVYAKKRSCLGQETLWCCG